jgi:hypothetical protein
MNCRFQPTSPGGWSWTPNLKSSISDSLTIPSLRYPKGAKLPYSFDVPKELGFIVELAVRGLEQKSGGRPRPEWYCAATMRSPSGSDGKQRVPPRVPASMPERPLRPNGPPLRQNELYIHHPTAGRATMCPGARR